MITNKTCSNNDVLNKLPNNGMHNWSAVIQHVNGSIDVVCSANIDLYLKHVENLTDRFKVDFSKLIITYAGMDGFINVSIYEVHDD